jgi:8-oxo-dGTP diphosphatase
MTAPRPHLIVTAAVIEQNDRFLITRRPTGAHLEGYWEFPGGKCDGRETLSACLVREIGEELDAGVQVGAEMYSVTHAYPERIVELHFFSCELVGEPRPLLGQEMRWATRDDLKTLHFPPADFELIALLAERRERRL